jgi:hypothetical protein
VEDQREIEHPYELAWHRPPGDPPPLYEASA